MLFVSASQARDFLVDIDFGVVANKTQFLDLGLEFGDRLFKIQEFQIHGGVFASTS